MDSSDSSDGDDNGHGSAQHDARSIFQSITMVDVLEQDPRPAFVVDLTCDNASDPSPIDPVFFNIALKQANNLLDVVTGQRDPSTYGSSPSPGYSAFKEWVFNSLVDDRFRKPLDYDGMSWTSMTINQRWRMVNAIPAPKREKVTVDSQDAYLGPKAVPVVDSAVSSPTSRGRSNGTEFEVGLPNWGTDAPPDISDHIRLLRGIDWSATTLGAISSWSPELVYTVNVMMAMPNPVLVNWGPEWVTLYNAAYAPILQSKHPEFLGKPAGQLFDRSWNSFALFRQRCMEGGHGATCEDSLFFMDRGNGVLEETYFSFDISPIINPKGEVLGWFNSVKETTSRKLRDRRMKTALEIGEKTAPASILKDFWQLLLKAFESNKHDISFAVLYSVGTSQIDQHVEHDPYSRRTVYELEGSIGVPEDHPSCPKIIESCRMAGFAKHFEQACRQTDPLYLQKPDLRVANKIGGSDETLLDGLYSRAFGDPCESVIILRLAPTGEPSGDMTLGFLVLGLNSRRPFNAKYGRFYRAIQSQIGTALGSLLLREEEIRRGRTYAEQAAIERTAMEDQLRIRTAQLDRRNLQLQHFTDSVPFPIFVLENFGPDAPWGEYAYRNDKWFEVTGSTQGEAMLGGSSPLWQKLYVEDAIMARGRISELLETRLPVNYELRVPRARSQAFLKEASEEERLNIDWYLCSLFPVVDNNGSLKSVIGSMTDITAQKFNEHLQQRRMEDALESKRQQENFIDVTSHEMRNPLSAIMISADEIMSTLRAIQRCKDAVPAKIIKNGIEAAQVIVDCAQHQKRIVDDILTISKLDSGLFPISPAAVQPETLVKNVLKMFQGEFSSAGISQTLRTDLSLTNLDVAWTMLDSSRLIQILINLVSNAIKFTRLSEKRHIGISISASLFQPQTTLHGNKYLRLRKPREDLTLRPEWGHGQPLYLEFNVEDTGKGLTADEKKVLFMRFSQAPRTHVNYGGSGLGLFISRELAEMQGGQIGVSSAGENLGSDFSFYIKVRRCVNLPSTNGVPADHGYFSNQAQVQSAIEEVRSAIRQDGDGPITPILTPTTPGSRVPQTPPTSRPCHVLIVEDNVVNQKVLKRQMLKLGYEVSIANHGVEALDFLKTTTYARDKKENSIDLGVVLMDSEMPVMNGLDCVSRIRSMQKEGVFNRHIPVIAITANARTEQVKQALDAGMDQVVAKPFRVPDLIAQIEKVLLDLREKGLEKDPAKSVRSNSITS